MKKIVNAALVTPQTVIEDACVLVEGGRIAACGPQTSQAGDPACEIFDAGGHYVIPGFMDIHCHGGGGHYVHEEPDAVADLHLRHGTTSLVATCLLLEPGELMTAVRTLCASRHPAMAGIHLEGPYLSKRYGARREMSRTPEPDEYNALLEAAGGRISIWTFAPELEGTDAFVEAAARHGIVLSVGHSEASARRIFELAPRGLKLGCHCMCATGVTPEPRGGVREVGVDEAVMVHEDIYAEVIPDSLGIHVRPLMLKLLLKAKGIDRTIVITDAVRDAGTPASGYVAVRPRDVDMHSWPWREMESLPPLSYINAENKALLEIAEDIHINSLGRLSGSRLTMDQAVRNMIRHTGVSLVEACRMASLNPAVLLGVDDTVGSLEPGKRANLAVVTEDIEVKSVMLDGEWVAVA